MDSSTGLRAADLRQSNLAAVIGVLRSGDASRSELVAATGLTRSAIAGLIVELGELGLVVESAGEPTGRPGRPSPRARLIPGAVGALAVDVSVTRLAVAIVGLDGRVLRSVERSGERSDATPTSTVADIVEMAERIGVGSSDGSPALVGVGVAIPGLVREHDGLVVVAPNLGWAEVDIVTPLRDALTLRTGLDLPIGIGNESDLGAVAEARFGAGSGSRNILFVHGDVGVGGSIIVDGGRVSGGSGYAGEVGHLVVNPDGVPCRCGGSGCWETEIGERVLLGRAGLDPNGGWAAISDLMTAAARGDREVMAALALQGRWMGVGLAGLINVLDPERIVLGGVLGELLELVRDELDAELARRRFGPSARRIPVVAAELGSDSLLVGAAELALGPALADPSRWAEVAY
ncbi:MAG: ROK family protein [Ilumatobacter sp.]|uniref:ROK family protein n=1 Tax=Ilumatobacter sp. TaxID=1967498 RepID=UPI003297A702